MSEQAKNTLEGITIEQIKTIIRTKVPEKYNRILVDEKQSILKVSYQYLKYKSKIAKRNPKKIDFPLYHDMRKFFEKYEGENADFRKSQQIEDSLLIKALTHFYKIDAVSTTLSESEMDFSFALENSEIKPKQPLWLIPTQTFSEKCSACEGSGLVSCRIDSCKGQHSHTCKVCNGQKEVQCKTCDGNKKVVCQTCEGKGDLICTHCGGKSCGHCRSGIQLCPTCLGDGNATCSQCQGQATMECDHCKGIGITICENCYSDPERRGKEVCPLCKGMQKMAKIVYVETQISESYFEKLLNYNGKLSKKVDDQMILNHCNRTSSLTTIYDKFSEVEKKYNDWDYDSLCLTAEKELNITRLGWPRILKTEIYFETVPCVKVFYRHVLTNSLQSLTILNIFENPEVVFDADPEEVKKLDVKNVLKTSISLFGKLFKTKQFVGKEDKKKKIKLMIHIAKADGEIEDKEKIYLNEMIGTLDNFTNSEKREFYSLMDVRDLPELKLDDVTFSKPEVQKNVVELLENLMNSDEALEESETLMIHKIKNLMASIPAPVVKKSFFSRFIKSRT